MIPQTLIDTFHKRISERIDEFKEGNFSTDLLQTSVNREIGRLKNVNGNVVPDEIKELLDNNNLKY